MLLSTVNGKPDLLIDIVTVLFSGCAVVVSVASLYLTLRSGPVRCYIEMNRNVMLMPNIDFTIPLIFHNGRKTAVVIQYHASLKERAEAFRLEGLFEKNTLLVAPNSYELLSLKGHTNSITSPISNTLQVEWVFLKGNEQMGPYLDQVELKLEPFEKGV